MIKIKSSIAVQEMPAALSACGSHGRPCSALSLACHQ
jgi:hypothetical protein